MGRVLWLLDRTAYVLLRLTVLSVRIAWAFTFGWLLAALYLLPGLLMSPFHMTYGGASEHTQQTAANILLLTPGEER